MSSLNIFINYGPVQFSHCATFWVGFFHSRFWYDKILILIYCNPSKHFSHKQNCQQQSNDFILPVPKVVAVGNRQWESVQGEGGGYKVMPTQSEMLATHAELLGISHRKTDGVLAVYIRFFFIHTAFVMIFKNSSGLFKSDNYLDRQILLD